MQGDGPTTCAPLIAGLAFIGLYSFKHTRNVHSITPYRHTQRDTDTQQTKQIPLQALDVPSRPEPQSSLAGEQAAQRVLAGWDGATAQVCNVQEDAERPQLVASQTLDVLVACRPDKMGQRMQAVGLAAGQIRWHSLAEVCRGRSQVVGMADMRE